MTSEISPSTDPRDGADDRGALVTSARLEEPSVVLLQLALLGWSLSKVGSMYLAQRKKTGTDVDVCWRDIRCFELREVRDRVRAEIKQKKSYRKSLHSENEKSWTQEEQIIEVEQLAERPRRKTKLRAKELFNAAAIASARRKSPRIPRRELFGRLNVLDSRKREWLSQTDPRVRRVMLDYIFHRSIDASGAIDVEKLRRLAAELSPRTLPELRELPPGVQQCLTCRVPYAPHDCQDTGHCPICTAALRQQRHYQARKQAPRISSVVPTKVQPKNDAMNKLQLPRPQGDAEDAQDADQSAWGGEKMWDAEGAGKWQQSADETPRPEDFANDEELKKLARECDRKGQPDAAQKIRKFMSSQRRQH